MSKREYIQANKDWLETKSKEEGVKALPGGIYYKVITEGEKMANTPHHEVSLPPTTQDGLLTANNSIAAEGAHLLRSA